MITLLLTLVCFQEIHSVHTVCGSPVIGITDNDTVVRDLYVVNINEQFKYPNWACYRVHPDNFVDAEEQKRRVWRVEPYLTDAERAEPKDFRAMEPIRKVDRGHIVPLGSFLNLPNSMTDTLNYLGNITPQLAHFNRGTWKRTENYERELAVKRGGYVYVMAGCEGRAPTIKFPHADEPVSAPRYFWKVIYVLAGDKIHYAALWFAYDVKGDFRQYRTTLAHIEKQSGLKFFLDCQSQLVDDLLDRF